MPIEFNTVIHRFSTVAGTAPAVAELYQGELALNLADGKLFTLSVSNEVLDLTSANSSFSLAGSLSGYLLTYDLNTGRYTPTNPLDFLDGGQY